MSESTAYRKDDADMIDLWRAMTAQGEDLPVVMPVRGVSMLPLLKAGRDSVTVIPLRRELMIGDIIVFRREDGFYVVHRVRALTQSDVETIGDNCLDPDAWFAYKDVCGLVSHIQRHRRLILIDTPFWRAYGRFWMRMLPVRAFYRKKIRSPLREVVRKVFGI